MVQAPTDKLDWANIGFQFRDLNGYMKYTWTEENGWDKGTFEKDSYLKVHMCAPGLHYGQQCFEGLKAFRDDDDHVRIFRPRMNAERMMRSADMAYMPRVPVEVFEEAVRRTVEGNLEYVPPKASGGSMYLRPVLFGSGPCIGMDAAPEFTFVVFGMPVGNYYKDGVKPVDAWVIEDFDRTAPNGTGATKVGGNYAPTFGPMKEAKKRGYPITLHLDSKTHTYIDEFSTSNFVALTAPDVNGRRTFVTPDSSTILASVTRLSLEDIAKKLGWQVERRPVKFEELEQGHFAEVAACGTAAIITPVKKFVRGDKVINIGSGDQQEIGEGFAQLYKEYRGIQGGDIEDTFGWMWPKEGL
ncbi:branched-chain amino acid aminotransferase [Radiomyces spectabilis]|uniref:branched-chain amino acid aminotransferase n=1 Tax=Radiomyces spectabilis TaxID=64574 RepID=UPI00221FE785|nr:branched-chain amino acid aminotransferase [Radiomyces spectabilis]KAI8388811.1 branched-chain amino acid aminotransferase [Radiomyces spectabilis]